MCRYPNLNVSCVKPKQVVQLFDGVVDPRELEEGPTEVPAKRARNVVPNGECCMMGSGEACGEHAH